MPYDSPSRPKARFYFDRFVATPTERLLECDGHPVQIGSRAFDILIALLEQPGEIISHRTLIDRAWPSVTVEEANLRVHIANLRRALSPTAGARTCIANVPGRGYSFTAPVRVGKADGGAAGSAAAAAGTPTSGSGARRLIGRDEDVKRVAELLRLHPLVSVVGPGGVGKTALAAHLSCALSDRFGAVHHLDLAHASSSGDLSAMLDRACAFVGSHYGARPDDDDDDGRPALIVIDTCENAVDAVATWSACILSTCPDCRILLTSREATRSPYEHVYVLSPFQVDLVADNDGASAGGSFAVELFKQSARAGGYSREFTDADVAQILSLCRRLDGNPLAIEIISGRVATHGIRETASLMDSPEWVLTQAMRGTEGRHRTLSALVGWSYDSLGAKDQMVMLRLSAFHGSFTMSAAEDVAADEDVSRCHVQGALSRLLERSLLIRSVENGMTRYRFANLVRIFGQAAAATTAVVSPGRVRYLAQPSVSRSALADLRSAVSSPSVNQL